MVLDAPAGTTSDEDAGEHEATLLAGVEPANDAPPATEAALREAFDLDPRDLEALGKLVELLVSSGQDQAAEELARKGVRHSPAAPRAHLLLGRCLASSPRPTEAAWHLKRSLVLSGERDRDTLARLAVCMRDAGDLGAARVLYEAIAESLPEEPGPLLASAEIEELDRDFAAASALLDRADALPQTRQSSRTSASVRATISSRTGKVADAAATLTGLVGPTPCGVRARLELGRLLARLGRHGGSFAEISKAKRDFVALTGRTYCADHANSWADSARAFFTPSNMALLPRASVRRDVPQPIFVIGFPRSGTSLMEQSLSSHPEIAAAGETPHMLDLADRVPGLLGSPLAYPDALSELWMAHGGSDVELLRDFYLGRVVSNERLQPGQSWFVDKHNNNAGVLGLISIAFPESPIIHMVRHPLDAVLSAYSLTLGAGCFNALELLDVARFYALFADVSDDLLKLCGPRCLTIRYEDVVDHQEATMRRVMDHVGVPFDPRVLAFTDNPRYTRNESYAQVAEPLYTRARGRYRDYMRHLEPVLPILGPTMERMGYEV